MDPVKKLLIAATVAAFGAAVVLPTAAIIGSTSVQAATKKKPAKVMKYRPDKKSKAGKTKKAPSQM
jgi:hypothetical protein